ncbi:ATP-binding protein [Cellulomonas sp. KRMCY2]|uniref:ATP-binding protein n=1 Tax=Cellulomonas sp. KRMCY2 TaxID=1304865 RepID=UPI00045EC1EB|nr:ATP-binding protein [Cellulomonas sp. KRMCY2]
MSNDRARRTPTGSMLRLVGPADAAVDAVPGGGTHPPGGDDPPEGGPDDAGANLASIVLPGQRQSVAVGRHWVVAEAVERGVTGMANQVVELLSSELLANAVLHGTTGTAIGVQIRHDDVVVRVSVSDGGTTEPVVLHNEPTAPNGRGMAIVEAMSTRWGVQAHSGGGKTVWFELDLADF